MFSSDNAIERCIIKKPIIIFMLTIAATLYAQETEISFHNFRWGTSLADFTARMGNPAHSDEINGLRSLVYENIRVSDYPVFMVAYFSQNGLEGGTYYFDTNSFEELIQCYKNLQVELQARYGETWIYHVIQNKNEMAPYESAWDLSNGFIKLKADTRRHEPVTLWYFSPTLTRFLIAGS